MPGATAASYCKYGDQGPYNNNPGMITTTAILKGNHTETPRCTSLKIKEIPTPCG